MTVAMRRLRDFPVEDRQRAVRVTSAMKQIAVELGGAALWAAMLEGFAGYEDVETVRDLAEEQIAREDRAKEIEDDARHYDLYGDFI